MVRLFFEVSSRRYKNFLAFPLLICICTRAALSRTCQKISNKIHDATQNFKFSKFQNCITCTTSTSTSSTSTSTASTSTSTSSTCTTSTSTSYSYTSHTSTSPTSNFAFITSSNFTPYT